MWLKASSIEAGNMLCRLQQSLRLDHLRKRVMANCPVEYRGPRCLRLMLVTAKAIKES
jgi:hypothetical protein